MSHTDPYGYDEIPYPSAPYPYSHPDHLATLAALFGLETPDVARCRVLEIGCADGANLIPMALTLPHSTFVGIDLSSRQIEAGNRVIVDLQLSNVRLLHQDLERWEVEQPFDYIVAHGFYSWTPPQTRDALLTFIRRTLSADGLAFVSYNVLPGWRNRLAIRHWLLAMLGPSSQSADGVVRVRKARILLEQLAASFTLHDGLQSELQEEVQRLLQWKPAYLRHDLLEEYNQPVTVSEFMDHLERHELQFLAEADLASMVGTDLAPEQARRLPHLARTVRAREQLIDLWTQRPFRQSIVCHAARRPATQLDASRLASLYAASILRPSPDRDARRSESPELFSNGGIEFAAKSGFRTVVHRRVVARALTRLALLWPATIQVRELIDSLNAQTPETDESDVDDLSQLCTILLAAFAERAVELHRCPAAFVREVSERPQASRLARWQASRQEWVTNLRHDVVPLDEPLRQLLPLLDGRRSRSEFVEAMRVDDAERDESWLEEQLVRCAKLALLEG